MADITTAKLQNSTSYPAILTGLASIKPLPLQLLEMTREGRVFGDGVANGMATTLGMTLGLPQRAARFIAEQTMGKRFETPLKDQWLSQEWFVAKLRDSHEMNLALQGRKREDKTSKTDHVLGFAGEMVPLVGSFFISAPSLIPKLPKLLATVGAQSWIAETAMDGVDWAEDKLGVWAGAPVNTPKVAKTGTSASFDAAASGDAVTQAPKSNIASPLVTNPIPQNSMAKGPL